MVEITKKTWTKEQVLKNIAKVKSDLEELELLELDTTEKQAELDSWRARLTELI